MTRSSTVSTYELNDDDSYEIALRRADYGDYGTGSISFDLEMQLTLLRITSGISITWTDEEDDRYITFNMGSSGNTVAITDFSFNAETGRAKGKFTLNGSNNSTDNNALVTGSFDVVAKPIVQ
jgi:hypothetical protein